MIWDEIWISIYFSVCVCDRSIFSVYEFVVWLWNCMLVCTDRCRFVSASWNLQHFWGSFLIVTLLRLKCLFGSLVLTFVTVTNWRDLLNEIVRHHLVAIMWLEEICRQNITQDAFSRAHTLSFACFFLFLALLLELFDCFFFSYLVDRSRLIRMLWMTIHASK